MIKTVNLTAGTETEVILTGGCHCCIENRGSGVIYASKSADIVPDSDGVTAIDKGNSKILRNIAQYKKSEDNSYDYYGKIYLLSDSDGKAEIQTANDLNFFSRKNSSKGGGTYDDTAIKSDIANLQTGKANKSEVYTKTATDHKICKVVCGKNNAAGWFKIGETICNTSRNTVGVTLIINPTYEGARTSNYNNTVNPTIILTIGARYQNDVVDPDKKIGIKNDIVVKPYDIYGTIFNENCVYVHYENETLSIYLKTLQNSQAYVITALSGYSSYLAPDVSYAWTFVDTNEPIELPTTGIGVYATDVTKAKYDSANNIISDTYVVKEDDKGLSTNDFTDGEKQKLAGIATGATNTVVDSALSTTSTNPVQNKVINTALNNKVDKAEGMGLSSNDYTTAEKNKLAGLENYDDTAIKTDITNLQTDTVKKTESYSMKVSTTSEKYCIFKFTGANRFSARFLICCNNSSRYGDVFINICFGTAKIKKYVLDSTTTISIVAEGTDNRTTYVIFNTGIYGSVTYVGTESCSSITTSVSNELPTGTALELTEL